MPAVAISNNDVIFLAWSVEAKIPGCLGFAVYRRDAGGAETALPAWVGFQGETNVDWHAKTTAVWPVQKFMWRDLTAKRGQTYTYRIVPMVGTPGNLTAKNEATITTASIGLSEKRGDFSAFFNRGILSTQSLAHQIPAGPSGAPNFTTLKGRIDQPGDPLRNRLSGQLREAMLGLFTRAKAEGLQLYCALYELTDTELEQQLLQNKDIVHLILSNTGVTDEENKPARDALHEAGIDITDRMVGNGHIGHNKFVVLVDGDTPKAVWTGSTNWTETGLCAQSNNGILIESPELAALYLDFWNRLKADDGAQGPELRADNNQAHRVAVDQGKTEISLWFSPNTKQKTKPAHNPTRPGDMQAIFDAMSAAKQAILFLIFQPGTPSIVDQSGELENNNPALYIHGAATDPKAVGEFSTHLFHKTGSFEETDVVAAAAINDQFGFWEKELLKAGPDAHAIIHDKIVVIDPFSPDCVVITGSHNMGYRASYCNDENLVIIRGNQALAQAYAVHVMDVYDHYRWRYMLQQKKNNAWTGLVPNDSWQDKYFMADSTSARELAFWMAGAGPANVRVSAHAAGSHQPPPRLPAHHAPAHTPATQHAGHHDETAGPTRKPRKR